jgi:Uma2 family endonuclease
MDRSRPAVKNYLNVFENFLRGKIVLMSAQSLPRMTLEEYVEAERASECRYEYYMGRIYAMAGGSLPHAIIASNIVREAGTALKDRPCIVTSSDLRIQTSPDGLYTFADVVIVCGEPRLAAAPKDTVTNPIAIVEVLSPSTEAHDRGFKFAQYRKIESLREYVLVSQTEPRIESFRRQSGGDWLLHEYSGMEQVCHFQSVNCDVPFTEIYARVPFNSEAAS